MGATRKIMVAVEAFMCEIDDRELIVTHGMRVAADHPAVKAHPGQFAPATDVDTTEQAA